MLNLHRKTVESTKEMSPAVLLGSSFALAMGFFAWVGHRWDLKNGSEPWGVLTGVCVGLLYGAYEVWKVTGSPEEESASSSKGKSEDPPSPPQG